jgi:topoisomerase IA-like protein
MILSDIYHDFLKIEKSGKFYRSLKKELDHLNIKLKSKIDYRWR